MVARAGMWWWPRPGCDNYCDDPSLEITIFMILISEFTKMPFEVNALTIVDFRVVSRKTRFLGISS